MMNTGLKYGVLCGSASSLWVLTEFALGFHTTSLEIGQYSGYFAVLIPVILIYAALRERSEKSDGRLTWKDGIDAGFRTAFFSALLFSLFMIAYRTVIHPEWIELTIEWQRRKLILGGATDAEISRFTELHRNTNSLIIQTFTGFIGSTTVSVVITLIEIPIVRLFGRTRK